MLSSNSQLLHETDRDSNVATNEKTFQNFTNVMSSAHCLLMTGRVVVTVD
jgi:hypothetical protein